MDSSEEDLSARLLLHSVKGHFDVSHTPYPPVVVPKLRAARKSGRRKSSVAESPRTLLRGVLEEKVARRSSVAPSDLRHILKPREADVNGKDISMESSEPEETGTPVSSLKKKRRHQSAFTKSMQEMSSSELILSSSSEKHSKDSLKEDIFVEEVLSPILTSSSSQDVAKARTKVSFSQHALKSNSLDLSDLSSAETIPNTDLQNLTNLSKVAGSDKAIVSTYTEKSLRENVSVRNVSGPRTARKTVHSKISGIQNSSVDSNKKQNLDASKPSLVASTTSASHEHSSVACKLDMSNVVSHRNASDLSSRSKTFMSLTTVNESLVEVPISPVQAVANESKFIESNLAYNNAVNNLSQQERLYSPRPPQSVEAGLIMNTRDSMNDSSDCEISGIPKRLDKMHANTSLENQKVESHAINPKLKKSAPGLTAVSEHSVSPPKSVIDNSNLQMSPLKNKMRQSDRYSSTTTTLPSKAVAHLKMHSTPFKEATAGMFKLMSVNISSVKGSDSSETFGQAIADDPEQHLSPDVFEEEKQKDVEEEGMNDVEEEIEDVEEAEYVPKQTTFPRSATKQASKKRRKTSSLSMPVGMTRDIIQHFAQMPVDTQCMPLINSCLDQFFSNTLSTLEAYAKHAGRSVIDIPDVELFLFRLKMCKDRNSLNALIEEYLSWELRRELIPCCKASNNTDL